MGTSTSSKGGGSGSPFDPEWLDAIGGDTGVALGGTENADGDGGSNEETLPSNADDSSDGNDANQNDGAALDGVGLGALAPNRRFAAARTNMSAFLSGGGRDALRSAAKNMVNKGMGGPRRAASTMRRTAQGAGQLGQFLASARDRSDPRVVDWVQRVRDANLSANDLILELLREVLPDTGSVDEESLRNAAAEALGKLYELEPEVDIFALTDDQIGEVIGLAIANDVCNRMDLLLGQTYERLKYDAHQIQLYRNDMKEFVTSEVRVVMGRHGALRADPQRLAQEVLTSTLEVFSE